MSPQEAETVIAKGQNKEWHYHPALPIKDSPVFSWPPRPRAALRWLSGYWLTVSMTIIEAGLAIAVYLWFQPPVEEMRQFSLGWVLQIWGRNIVIISIFAMGLQLCLWEWKRQDRQLKFDYREQAKNNGNFTFRSQLCDNMFWTLASGVSFWTAWEVIYFWAAANGYVPGVTFVENPIWFIAFMVILPIWSSFHFYWVHRALHWPPLYRLAHALHHRNVNTGPWTGISMHPVEHLLYFTNFAIHFVVPSHPIHFLFHAYLQTIGPVASHSGFEGLIVRDERRLKLGDFFHQLHHRYFECNYGTVEMPWDRWFGSFHDGTPDATAMVRERRKRIFGG